MKKVCHLTSAHKRYDVRIFEKECVSLSKNGFEVTLIVNDDFDLEEKSLVKIKSTNYIPNNRLSRIVFSTKKIYKLAVEEDAEIYHLHDPELLLLAKRLKKLGKIVIFDAHEDTEAQIMDKEWIPYSIRRIIAKVYKVYSKNILENTNAIITVTPQLLEKFKSININTIMVTNYPILFDDYCKNYQENTVSPYVCFAGGISEQWNHDKIIKALESINNIKYFLAGTTALPYLKTLESLNGWNKVNYIGKIPHGEVLSIQKHSVAGMAINYSNQIKVYGTLGNTKLFEYMAAGIPVICSNYIIWKEIIEKYNCGICVDPNSIEEIKKAITFILEHPNQSEKMGKNGRKAVEIEYNWKSEESKLLELYNRF